MPSIAAHTHHFRATARTTTFILLTALCTSYTWADIVLDGSMGTTGTLSGNKIEITDNMGQTRGNNLFHSFQTFDLTSSQTANFSGPVSVQNIIGRITGGPSSIDGTISSSINGANLYLLNPNGILFGANATIDITGSFHASSADSLKFTDDLVLYTDPSRDLVLSSASPSAFGFLPGSSGSITIDGSQLSVGVGNTLSLVAGEIKLNNGASITAEDGQVNIASVASSGVVEFTGGDIRMNGFQAMGNIFVENNSQVSSSGNGGGRIVIRGGKLTLDSSNISADTTGTGTSNQYAGIDISLTRELRIDNNAHISTNAKMLTSGDSNDITISAGDISIDNKSSIESLGENDNDWYESPSTGDSGDISIRANNLSISNLSTISTHSLGTGNTGNVSIIANDITIEGSIGNGEPDNIDEKTFTGIITSTNSDSNAGSGAIDISANDILISNAARISSNIFGDNDAGNITINNKNLSILSGARVQSLSLGGSGNAGNISINSVNNIIVSGVYSKPGYFDFLPPVVEESQIQTNAGGNKGNISISANTLKVLDGAKISAHKAFLGVNDAGNIKIRTNKLVVSGVNQEMYDNSILQDSTPENAYIESLSSINTEALGIGSEIGPFPNDPGTNLNAGNIDIKTDSLILTDGGQLSSAVLGFTFDAETKSTAGNIGISASELTVSNGAKISSGSLYSGAAGSILIDSSTMVMDGNTIEGSLTEGQSTGLFSSANTDQAVNAGDITLNSKQLILKGGATIASESSGLGSGGNIEIKTHDFQLLSNSSITSNASGVGTAGNIDIQSNNQINLVDSYITTKAELSDGGNIRINTNNNVYVKSSTISTSVENGKGNGGNIDIAANSIVLDDSNVLASAIGGNGGNINIRTNQIYVTPSSVIDATSVLKVDGEINIQNLVESKANLSSITADTGKTIVVSNNQCNANRMNSSSLYVSDSKQYRTNIFEDMLSEYSDSNYNSVGTPTEIVSASTEVIGINPGMEQYKNLISSFENLHEKADTSLLDCNKTTM